MNSSLWAALRQGFQHAALPLAWYYAVTLGVPLANGAAKSNAGFVKHAITVAVVPPIAIVLACAVHSSVRVATVCWRSRARAEGHPRAAAGSS
jgi:hypothetical protein